MKRYPSGYYAMRHSEAWVFAFDSKICDAVWIRSGSETEILEQDLEGIWELPETEEDCAAFCERFGFERMTAKQAEPHIKAYINKVYYELLNPEINGEIISNPSMSIQFVRAVKNFMLDVEEIN